MSCAEIIRQIPLYCYGEVGSEAEERIESHLAECPACRDELARYRLFLELLDTREDARSDDTASLLLTCRTDLRREIAKAPAPEGGGLLDFLRGLAAFHIPFKVPVGAMALVALGFFGARYTPEKFGGLAAGMSADPTFSSVRSVEAGAAGKVQISVDEVRRHVVRGSLQDPRIQGLLLSAAREESNPGIRVESLGMLKDSADSEEVRQTLLYVVTHDPNAGVRLKALEGLKPYAGNVAVRKTLATVLQKDDNPGVRVQAIDLLTSHHDDSLVGVLQDVVQKEDNNYVRARCSRLLEEMKASVGTYSTPGPLVPSSMKLSGFLLLLALCAQAVPDDIQVDRDGNLWKVAVRGSLPSQPVFRITAGGDLTVRGTNSKEIRYVISGRMRGGDEAGARRAAGEFRVLQGPGQLVFPASAAVRVELPRKSPYLSLWTPAGAIDAAGLDGSVRVDSAAGKIMLDHIGGDAEIHSAGGGVTIGSIGGVVRCYSGGGAIRAVRVRGGATFQSGGGDIQLGEVTGPVRAITAAGGIRIDHAGGTVYADTFGGPISILRAFGIVVARSAGGPIDVAQAPSVHCQSDSGAIRLNNVSGQLRASTQRGSIVAEILPGRPLADSWLSTRAGDITVFIPSDTGVTIQAECGGPQSAEPIVSDYSGLRIEARGRAAVAEGNINGGGPVLRLSNAGGRIEIRKR